MYFIMIMGKLAATREGPVCFDTDDDAAEWIASNGGQYTVEYVDGDDTEAFIVDTPEIQLSTVRTGAGEQTEEGVL